MGLPYKINPQCLWMCQFSSLPRGKASSNCCLSIYPNFVGPSIYLLIHLFHCVIFTVQLLLDTLLPTKRYAHQSGLRTKDTHIMH